MCKTSEVVVEKLSGYIETDQCVKACGVCRESVGISSDAFLSSEFTAHLCSPACFHNCLNIVDLFSNLAASEADVICENLPTNLCSFAIASSGKRCVLENNKNTQEKTCKTSEIVVEKLSGYIETDQCVKACGVCRESVGVSSDAFLSSKFTAHLCSPACYHNCPNIVDLFFNLAAGEADVICENLPTNLCSFAIASSGKRCVLENHKNAQEKTCKTSEVVVEKLFGYIETDQCVKACGVCRDSVEVSSDAFLSSEFTAHLCSPACYHNCPNIVDLFFNLAAGEGVSLPALCKNQEEKHREMLTILSSGGVNPGPVAAPLVAPAPASL
ncbi:UNVERIFIED_CONTAM: hypothetical protein Sradi_3943500 [Sesamum radiatum]|uniref:Uncharacterized protein n=1 Tax=Sesamum radiatum TaxID=300843 RepID=A0AAW2PKD9_SESRA